MGNIKEKVAKKPKILVVGSMNMDLFVEGANSIPKYGESIPCTGYGYAIGGKGSNQAFAAAKQGADVVAVGRIGDDKNGKQINNSLKQANVNTNYIVIDKHCQTGLALMMLDKNGRYVSYVAMGANNKVSVEDVRKALDENKFDMILMQLEIPLETVYKTYELAKERDIPVFLDAGPAMKIPLEKLKGLFILSPNEVETEVLTDISVSTNEGALKAAKFLYEKAEPEYVILKLGERGALLYNGSEAKFIECFKVEAIDSTAAGDTFGAALAIQLCKGVKMEAAILFAHAAAGICVSRKGAQTSIPTEEEVKKFLIAKIGGVPK